MIFIPFAAPALLVAALGAACADDADCSADSVCWGRLGEHEGACTVLPPAESFSLDLAVEVRNLVVLDDEHEGLDATFIVTSDQDVVRLERVFFFDAAGHLARSTSVDCDAENTLSSKTYVPTTVRFRPGSRFFDEAPSIRISCQDGTEQVASMPFLGLARGDDVVVAVRGFFSDGRLFYAAASTTIE
jgi:hypothetical protein